MNGKVNQVVFLSFIFIVISVFLRLVRHFCGALGCALALYGDVRLCRRAVVFVSEKGESSESEPPSRHAIALCLTHRPFGHSAVALVSLPIQSWTFRFTCAAFL